MKTEYREYVYLYYIFIIKLIHNKVTLLTHTLTQ